MTSIPVPARPVGAGRYAIRHDPQQIGGRIISKWAIVTEAPILGQKLVGWKRGYGENHAGLYCYRFRKHSTALKVLRKVLAGHPVQDGLA